MEVKDVKKQDTVCIKARTPVDKLPEVLGQGYGEIAQYAGQHGVQLAGAPYALYLNEDMSDLQIEFGFPVAGSIVKQGRVESGELPGGKVLVDMHVGSYESIADAYNRMMAYMKEKNLEGAGQCWELYMNDPDETPPEQLKTEIYFLLKG